MGNLKDYATSTILVAPSPATSGTTLEVQVGHGARFPAAPFMVTVHPPSEFPTLDNAEKLEVTAVNGDEFTVLRAQGDTDAKAIEAGWRISNALFFDDIPVVNSTTVNAAGAVMESDTSTASMSFVLDEDDMSSNSATKLSTQQSIKAYIDNAISTAKEALLPVGSIVVLGVSTNPSTLYGFGTWTAIEGRVLVGKGSSGTFQTLDDTGGVEKVSLTNANIPRYDGIVSFHGAGSATVLANVTNGSGLSPGTLRSGAYRSGGGNISGSQSRDSFSLNIGQSNPTPLNNLQPYIVKYMWQRTA